VPKLVQTRIRLSSPVVELPAPKTSSKSTSKTPAPQVVRSPSPVPSIPDSGVVFLIQGTPASKETLDTLFEELQRRSSQTLAPFGTQAYRSVVVDLATKNSLPDHPDLADNMPEKPKVRSLC
jgi:hypothetical protein